MASDTSPQSWAKLKDAQSIERQRKKLSDLRSKIARERGADLENLVGAVNDDVDARIEALVDGDVNTHSPAVQQAVEAERDLHTERTNLLTDLELLKPRYARACAERAAHLDRMGKWSENSLSARLPGAQGSKWTLVLAVAGLVALESIMLRRPAESMVRSLFPEWNSVTVPALLIVAGFTLLSALTLALSGRSWKEYTTAVARFKIAEESEDTTAVPKASLASPAAWSGAALATQTILAILRVQIDTDSSQARATLVLFSLLLVFIAFSIVLIEYRTHKPDDTTGVTWDEATIATYLGMWTRAYSHIPQELATARRVRLEAKKSALHDLQRIAPSVEDEGTILGAINRYLAKIDAEIKSIVVPEFGGVPDEHGNADVVDVRNAPSPQSGSPTYNGPVAEDVL